MGAVDRRLAIPRSSNSPVGAPTMQTLPEAAIIDNSLFRALVNQVSALSRNLVGANATFAEVEGGSLQIANLAVREHLRRDLQRRSDALAKELLVDGKEYHQHLAGEETYHSLTGGLAVRRFTYRQAGVRNGPTLVPLELMAGLVEGATPALGYSVTLGYAQDELRAYAEGMEAAHRCLPSRSTLERMAKAIGSEALKEAPRIEACLRRTERVPAEAEGISMGLDRASVPMEEDRPEDAPPKTRRKERRKPYERAKPTPIDVNYRMAYVGTVSLVDQDGEELVTRRYTALPDAEPDEVVSRMVKDVENARRQNDALKLVVVQDGAPEMWGATTRGLKEAGLKKWYEVIDRYHLSERLAAALLMVEPDAVARKLKMSEWNEDLDSSDKAIDRIQNWLGEQVDKVKGRDVEEKYLGHLVYLERNQARMKYATVKRKGLPIGSGLTEGACKSVIGQRTCGSGQRWRPEGIGAVLTLRAIHRSDRLPRFWRELSKNYTAKIITCATKAAA